jgi:hypothetical protein
LFENFDVNFFVHIPIIPNILLFVLHFAWLSSYNFLLSNTVADLVQNSTTGYLYIMNSLLLGIPASGTINTALSRFLGAAYSFNNDRPSIGDTGMHCDYRDGTSSQIGYHIWSYITAAAGSVLSEITITGVLLYDRPEDGTALDRLSGLLGVDTWWGRIPQIAGLWFDSDTGREHYAGGDPTDCAVFGASATNVDLCLVREVLAWLRP